MDGRADGRRGFILDKGYMFFRRRRPGKVRGGGKNDASRAQILGMVAVCAGAACCRGDEIRCMRS